MEESNSKVLSYGLMAFMAISVGLIVIYATGNITEDILIYWGYVLVIIPTVASIVFPIISMASDIKSAKGTLIGMGGLIAIFVLSYFLASSDTYSYFEKYEITGETGKMVGAAIISFYILITGAIGSVIFAELSLLLRK